MTPQYIAPLSMPPSNSALKAETTTAAGGCLYTGPTRIKLLASGKMTVKSPFSKQTNNSRLPDQRDHADLTAESTA